MTGKMSPSTKRMSPRDVDRIWQKLRTFRNGYGIVAGKNTSTYEWAPFEHIGLCGAIG